MAENAITKVARIAAHAAQGLVYRDSTGKEQTILPTGDKNMIDISGLSISNGSGGDTGGGDNSDHPSAGADYYAGSLADGEITERELLWQGESDPTKTTNATLLKDVGAKFNMAGDGAFILVHLLKTVMNAGVKGATSEVKLNYDVNNVAKDGYFTTTSPYPIYIHASDLATHHELIVPLNGIGENLGGKNFKAPELHITYKDDKTINISTVTGYDNDGADSGTTGANYDVVADAISTFSTQAAVAQLPSSINLFSGLAKGEIVLAGATEFYENIMDGIEITFDDNLYQADMVRRVEGSKFLKSKVIRIPKAQLINNLSFVDIPYNSNATNVQKLAQRGDSWLSIDQGNPESFKVADKPVITIESGSIKISGSFKNSSTGYFVFYLNISKVTPYKD